MGILPELNTHTCCSCYLASQEVELLTQRVNFCVNPVLDGLLLWLWLLLIALLVPSVGNSNRHVVLGDLVSVLTRRWDFDRTSPVEIKVTKGVGELLNVQL